MGANGFDLGGSLASSILNFAANERNNYIQTKLQREAQDWNAQQAAQANEWSIQQWNRENAYNDPSAQMERLSKAGINPALAYASGVFNQAATSPDVSMPEGAKAARTQAWQTDPMLFSSLQTAEAERDLIKSQANKEDALANYYKEQLPYYKQLIEESKKRVQDYDSQISKRMAEISLLSADEKLRIAQEAHIHFEEWNDMHLLNNADRELDAKIELWQNEGEHHKASAAREWSEKKLNDRELWELVQTYGIRFGKMQADMWHERYENGEIFARLAQLGIVVDENGRISVEPGGYTDVIESDVYQYAQAICELIGKIFGVTFGVVSPVGKTKKAATVAGFGKRS